MKVRKAHSAVRLGRDTGREPASCAGGRDKTPSRCNAPCVTRLCPGNVGAKWFLKLNSAVRGCIGQTMAHLCGSLEAARGRRFFVEVECRWSSVGAEGERTSEDV